MLTPTIRSSIILLKVMSNRLDLMQEDRMSPCKEEVLHQNFMYHDNIICHV